VLIPSFTGFSILPLLGRLSVDITVSDKGFNISRSSLESGNPKTAIWGYREVQHP
jgi:hypothetical protein